MKTAYRRKVVFCKGGPGSACPECATGCIGHVVMVAASKSRGY